MALLECKECSKEVSSEAVTCPHCGIAAPGVPDKTIEAAAKRGGYLAQRWIAGLAFWPGLIMVLLPIFNGADKEVVIEAWQISKWFMGFGFIWYVASEIERNLFERKQAKVLKS